MSAKVCQTSVLGIHEAQVWLQPQLHAAVPEAPRVGRRLAWTQSCQKCPPSTEVSKCVYADALVRRAPGPGPALGGTDPNQVTTPLNSRFKGLGQGAARQLAHRKAGGQRTRASAELAWHIWAAVEVGRSDTNRLVKVRHERPQAQLHCTLCLYDILCRAGTCRSMSICDQITGASVALGEIGCRRRSQPQPGALHIPLTLRVACRLSWPNQVVGSRN